MANIAAAMRKLGPDAKRVQVLFVSVDPERDTPEVLKQYVSGFDPAFLGLSGDVETTKKIASDFKAFYQTKAAAKDRASRRRSLDRYVYIRYQGTSAALRYERKRC